MLVYVYFLAIDHNIKGDTIEINYDSYVLYFNVDYLPIVNDRC